MGGYGSGRKGYLTCTEDVWSIPIKSFPPHIFSHVGSQFTLQAEGVDRVAITIEKGQLVFSYAVLTQEKQWEKRECSVRLQTTPCTYGGIRYWFTCPSKFCEKRVGVLYGGKPLFTCRHCQHLSYRSQRETAEVRAIDRAEKMRKKLGWENAVVRPSGSRPKGMHHTTFRRLMGKYKHLIKNVIKESLKTH